MYPGDPNAGGAGRSAILTQLHDTLRRLRTDWIDLYQLHRPDGITPLGETLAALDDLVHSGKVRYIGSSNLAAWQVADADSISRELGIARYVSAQNHYSLLSRSIELDLVPCCVAHHVSVIPYFPLASGFLTGKWRRGDEPPAGSRLSEPWGKAMATSNKRPSD